MNSSNMHSVLPVSGVWPLASCLCHRRVEPIDPNHPFIRSIEKSTRGRSRAAAFVLSKSTDLKSPPANLRIAVSIFSSGCVQGLGLFEEFHYENPYPEI